MANDHAKNPGPVTQEHPYPPAMSPYAQPLRVAYPPGYPIYYVAHGENAGPQHMVTSAAPDPCIPPPPGQGFPQCPQPMPAVANGQHGKRKRIKMACANRTYACKRCDEARPCERCIRYGIQDGCVDGYTFQPNTMIARGSPVVFGLPPSPGVSQGATTTESLQMLPAPVTANGGTARRKGWIGVERGAAPSVMEFASALLAVSSNQPRAALLFIGAGIVIVGLYFIIPPRDDENTHPIVSNFLRRLRDVFVAVACIFIVLGVGTAFPNEVALIPLFLFVSLAALAALFGMTLGVWATATLYGAALVSLATFVVLAFMA